MNKNYYEILEIDKHASEEIIKKAYTTLAKKYHPDLQPEETKKISEEKFKIINEAYETLSDPSKREQYDINLSIREQQNSNLSDDLLNENARLKNEINKIKNYTYSDESISNDSYNINSNQEIYQQELKKAVEKAYYDAYLNDLKNRGYKIKYTKSLKDYLLDFVAIVLVFLIFFILFQIPFIKNYFINLYNENFAFQFIVDFFTSIINAIFKKN